MFRLTLHFGGNGGNITEVMLGSLIAFYQGVHDFDLPPLIKTMPTRRLQYKCCLYGLMVSYFVQ